MKKNETKWKQKKWNGWDSWAGQDCWKSSLWIGTSDSLSNSPGTQTQILYIATGRPVLQIIEISASDGFYEMEKGWFANHSLPANFVSESSGDVSGARCCRVAETRESDSLWSCRRLEPLGFHWRVGEGWVAVVLSRASTRSRLTSRVSTE